jgi:hypothetical protein
MQAFFAIFKFSLILKEKKEKANEKKENKIIRR